MARIKRGLNKSKYRRKLMKLVKGFRAGRRRNYRLANEAMLHSLSYAYRDRRVRKRDFRSLWIVRISAAVREAGLSYSKFMHGLKLAGIEMDRKVLAETAAADAAQFGLIIDQVKTALAAPAK